MIRCLEQQKQLHAANTAAIVAAKSTSSGSRISNFSLDGDVNTSCGQCSEDLEMDPEALARTSSGT